jgi:hypothetical protein
LSEVAHTVELQQQQELQNTKSSDVLVDGDEQYFTESSSSEKKLEILCPSCRKRKREEK